MLRLVGLFALFVGCIASPVHRIVNGTNAAEGEIPYIVSLRYGGSHTCGGSILDATHILTAAHCVNGRTSNPSRFSIQYGSLRLNNNDPNAITAKSIVMHPKYQEGNGYHNDVAVITLEKSIVFGPTVIPTNLPPAFNSTPGNQGAVLAGWGLPYSGGSVMVNLQRVDIKVYTDYDCERAHNGGTNRAYHVCAGIPEGGKGQCSGDSGGPLNVNGVQVGVVSWSVKPCTIRGYPGVFAKVANYVDWIKSQM